MFEVSGQFLKASHPVILQGVVYDVLYIEPDPIDVPVSELGNLVFREFPGLSCIGRWGKPELFFEVFLGSYAPSNIVGQVDLQTIFFDSGRNDMHMLMFSIVMADYDIGLFAIAHMFHIIFGELEKVPVVQMFAPGQVKGDMCIPFFGTVPIAEMIKYATEKRHVGIGIGIGILETEYGAFRLARYVVQYALYIVPIKYPCYHSWFL